MKKATASGVAVPLDREEFVHAKGSMWHWEIM